MVLAFWNGRTRSEPWTLGAAIVFLAGLHVTSVHAPVIRKVFEGDLPAGDALFHTSGGPPLLVLGMWMLVTEMRHGTTSGHRGSRGPRQSA